MECKSRGNSEFEEAGSWVRGWSRGGSNLLIIVRHVQTVQRSAYDIKVFSKSVAFLLESYFWIFVSVVTDHSATPGLLNLKKQVLVRALLQEACSLPYSPGICTMVGVPNSGFGSYC